MDRLWWALFPLKLAPSYDGFPINLKLVLSIAKVTAINAAVCFTLVGSAVCAWRIAS